MTGNTADTVDAFLAELLPERRSVVSAMREMVNAHMPPGYEEAMSWGMICWQIPLARYPATYNKLPLNYVSLAALKNNYALHLMAVYAEGEQERTLRAAAAAQGRKLDMGKSCVRFRKPDDLPLQAIGEVIASMPVEVYIASHEAARGIVH